MIEDQEEKRMKVMKDYGKHLVKSSNEKVYLTPYI